MTDFIERLKVEQTELADKVGKLSAFTKSEKFDELDFANKYLLTKQLELMVEYNVILLARLSILDKGE